ncbi:MAG: DsrE family protein [Desulforhopalus sp.]
MKNKITVILFTYFFLTFLPALDSNAAPAINDQEALAGVQVTRSLFDINITEPEKLLLYLTVIRKTHEDLIRQGQKPEFVIAFRGASVRLITTETWSYAEEDERMLKESAMLLKEFKESGVTLEACSIATKLFKIDNQTILPEVQVVGNTFVSLIGYQTKGYALIPIQ